MTAPVQIVQAVTVPSQQHAAFAVERTRASAAVAAGAAADVEPGTVSLTPEEMVVVSIGRTDAASIWWRGSADGTGWRHRLGMALRRAAGIRGVQSLASERLEVLRLLTCMVVRRDPRAPETAARLVALGMAPSAVQKAIHLAAEGTADVFATSRSPLAG